MTYKKESKLKEEIFLFCQCFLILKYGLQTDEYQNLAGIVENRIKTLVSGHSQKPYEKWQRMIAKLNSQAGTLELFKEGESSHRAVLTIYSLILNLKQSGCEIPEEVEALMEILLEIENKQPMDEGEWIKLKKSADKRGLKILEKLKNLNYFT